jgi:hypothetical protein
MTCEYVTVDYPSEKLIPLLDKAILGISQEITDKETVVNERTKAYNSLKWWEQIFTEEPHGFGGSNWIDEWQISRRLNEKQNLKNIRNLASVGETVRMDGTTLNAIDYWVRRHNGNNNGLL